MTRITYIPNRVIDTDGIADGALIYVSQAGGVIPVSIFSDAAYSTPVANPYPVDAGAAVPSLFTNYAGDIRVRVVTTSGDVPFDEDPYQAFVTQNTLESEDGAGTIGIEGGGTLQDIADASDLQVVASGDRDPLVSIDATGVTFGDTLTAELATYPGARILRQEGLDIFVRPDLPDGAVDAERYGVSAAEDPQENGGIIGWLASARSYRKIVFRDGYLPLAGCELSDVSAENKSIDGLVLDLGGTVKNTTTDGTPMFLLNPNATAAGDAIRGLRIAATNLKNVAGAGHFFDMEGAVFHSMHMLDGVTDITNSSDVAALFYFRNSGAEPGRWTNVAINGTILRHSQNATIPAVWQDIDGSKMNRVVWNPGQCFCPDAVPFFYLMNRSTTSYNDDVYFNTPMEYAIAGAIHLTGFNQPVIETQIVDHTHWDGVGDINYLADQIYLGDFDSYKTRYSAASWFVDHTTSSSATDCPGAQIRRYRRDSVTDALTGTYRDIYIDRADGFQVNGVVPSSSGATRTIGIKLPSAQQGTVGPQIRNVQLFDYDESNHNVISSDPENISFAGMNVDAAITVDGTQVIGPRGASVADPTGGATVDAEARAQLSALISRLEAHGLIATV